MISRSRHAAVVLMLVLAGTAGCGRHSADPPTLYVVARAGPLARDPLATFDESGAVVFVNVFDQVVRYPPGPGDRRGVIELDRVRIPR